MRSRLAPIFVMISLAGCGALPFSHSDGGAADARQFDGGESVALTLDTFSVPAGGEVYKCQDFANPFGGAEVSVSGFESHMTPGSHHLLMFFKDGASNGALSDCSGVEFGAGPYGSQRPDDQISYPPGIGVTIAPSRGFRVQVHYLNSSPNPIEPQAQVLFHVAQPGSITNRAAVLFFNNTSIVVPPGATPTTISKTCTIPYDINLLQSTGHMHLAGTDFLATAGATRLFESSTWENVAPAMYDPPLALKAGSTVTFACTYLNTTGVALTFGESARTNEMCIFTGQFYPAIGDGLGCQ